MDFDRSVQHSASVCAVGRKATERVLDGSAVSFSLLSNRCTLYRQTYTFAVPFSIPVLFSPVTVPQVRVSLARISKIRVHIAQNGCESVLAKFLC